MPTFTTIALENLLEPRNSGKNSSTLKHPQASTNKPKSLQNHEEENDERSKPSKRLNHIYISPALYTTPEPTPILDYSSSGSLSPSPYVFNRKGRGGGKLSNRRIDGFEVQENGNQFGGNGGGDEELVESSLFAGGDEGQNCFVDEGEGANDDDFVDPRCDSLSIASSCELNEFGRLGVENMSVVSNQAGEFYDAIEDFSSDGSMMSNIASCSRNLESELTATRLSLLKEIEKRKTAEDEVATMSIQWQKITQILLPQPGPIHFDINAMKQLCQEVVVTKYVDEAIAKAEARAEAEAAAAVIIESKDKELSRLRDRLQYYEAMIHEMSQKNLESMEVGRRQRERKRGQRKWLWSCLGVSVVIGASVIACSYAPTLSDPNNPEGGNDL